MAFSERFNKAMVAVDRVIASCEPLANSDPVIREHLENLKFKRSLIPEADRIRETEGEEVALNWFYAEVRLYEENNKEKH